MSAALAVAPVTVAEELTAATRDLRAAGVESPRLDAEILLAHTLGIMRPRLLLNPGHPLDAAALARFRTLVRARQRREPVSRLCGEREFWSLPFAIDAAVLDPRPDSETLISAALDRLPDRVQPWRIADWGTGSGCLLLALLSELPGAWGVGIDISPTALARARANASALGLSQRSAFVASDWASGLDARFDVILCNPPYLSQAELATLEPEVSYDPPGALDGGEDGLAAYRRVARELYRTLAVEGFAAIEIGASQRKAVEGILDEARLTAAECRVDLAGRPRCIIAKHSGK